LQGRVANRRPALFAFGNNHISPLPVGDPRSTASPVENPRA
jgi:hypothetical protein